MTPWQLRRAVKTIHQGGIIAYPTEAVFGLGCDPLNPDAVQRLLAVKQRPVDKGLILIASNLEQLQPFIQPLSKTNLAKIRKTWPGPVTWLLPKSDTCPDWLSGQHDTIACRVSAHPAVIELCEAAGTALISTSANRAGQAPFRTAQQVRLHIGKDIDQVISDPVGTLANPTPIRTLDNRVIRG